MNSEPLFKNTLLGVLVAVTTLVETQPTANAADVLEAIETAIRDALDSKPAVVPVDGPCSGNGRSAQYAAKRLAQEVACVLPYARCEMSQESLRYIQCLLDRVWRWESHAADLLESEWREEVKS